MISRLAASYVRELDIKIRVAYLAVDHRMKGEVSENACVEAQQAASAAAVDRRRIVPAKLSCKNTCLVG